MVSFQCFPRSSGLPDCRQAETMSEQVVQSAELLSYERFCLYTCKPLLRQEIKSKVDCVHLSHEEVTHDAQSPSSNGREIIYEAHPLTKVGPISKLVPLPEASMLGLNAAMTSDAVASIRGAFAKLRTFEAESGGISSYTLPNAAKAPSLCVCHCGSHVDRFKQSESDGTVYPKPKKMPLAVTSPRRLVDSKRLSDWLKDLPELIDITIEMGAKLFVSAVGVPPKFVVDKLHAAGIPVMNMQVPVIAAGGICDGRHLAMSMALGADAVWVGTRFVASVEGGAPKGHKEDVVKAGVHDTHRTEIYTGRPMRIIKNKYSENWEVERNKEMRDLLKKGVIPYTTDVELLEEKAEGKKQDVPTPVGTSSSASGTSGSLWPSAIRRVGY
eukprot:g20639.t1